MSSLNERVEAEMKKPKWFMDPRLSKFPKLQQDLVWWLAEFLEQSGIKKAAARERAEAIVDEQFTKVVFCIIGNELADNSCKFFKKMSEKLQLNVPIFDLDVEDWTPDYLADLVAHHHRKEIKRAKQDAVKDWLRKK
jgi:hypothetical protein